MRHTETTDAARAADYLRRALAEVDQHPHGSDERTLKAADLVGAVRSLLAPYGYLAEYGSPAEPAHAARPA